MSESNVSIKMTDHGRGEVYLNGEKVPGVKAVSISVGVGEVNELTLTIMPTKIDVEGVLEVTTIECDARSFEAGDEG